MAHEKEREKEKLRARHMSHRRAAPELPPDTSPTSPSSSSPTGGASGGRVALVSKLVTDDFGLLGDDGRLYRGSQTGVVVSARPVDATAAAALAAAERAADSGAHPEHLLAASAATPVADLVAALRAQHGPAGACAGCCARSRPSSAAAASMKSAARPGSGASSKRASSRPGSAGRVVAAHGGTSQIFARRASSRPSSALGPRSSQTQMHSLPLQLLEL